MIVVSDLDDADKTARLGEGSTYSNDVPTTAPTGQLNATIDVPSEDAEEKPKKKRFLDF
jgi:hypothetical protein